MISYNTNPIAAKDATQNAAAEDNLLAAPVNVAGAEVLDGVDELVLLAPGATIVKFAQVRRVVLLL